MPARLVAAQRPGHRAPVAWKHEACPREHWSWDGFARCVRRHHLAQARKNAVEELEAAKKHTVFATMPR